MKYFWIRFKKRIKALGQLVLVFGAAGLVLLYFLGYYDFTFIDRYMDQYRFLYEDSQKAQGGGSLAESLASLIDLSDVMEEEEEREKREKAPLHRENNVTNSGGTEEEQDQEPQYTSAAKVYDTAKLDDRPAKTATVEELTKQGYEITDGVYDYVPGKTMLGKMTFRFQLPERYSLRKRTVERTEVLTGEDDTGYYTETSKGREDRPAVELYMGLLLIDKGSDLYLISSDGDPLCKFKATRYEPAYERDKEGHPLFRRELEDGGYAYFYLAEGGTNFVSSDFRPITDTRGLKFDYPADFGLSDSETIFTDRNQTSGLFAYLIRPEIEEEPEPEAETEAGTETAETAATTETAETTDTTDTAETTESADTAESAENTEPEPEPEPPKPAPEPEKLTNYVFSSAFAFTSGRAAVTTTANRGALFYIDETGQEAFGGLTSYYNVYDRYVTEILLPPLTTGPESLGFYYFDHGLTRVRRQIYDWWNWYYRSRLRVVEDKDLLVRPDGSIYELPTGYELEAYSEGMLMLSKNGAVGFTDYSGAWIAQPIFADAEPFIQGLAVLTTADGRKGMIDTEGNIVLPFAYDSLTSVSSGLIAAYQEETGWSVFRFMKPAGADESGAEDELTLPEESTIE